MKSSRSSFIDAREQARTLAFDALLYLANDLEQLGRFLTETGLDPARLRQAAKEPSFAGAMLDYLCANESLLVAFAAEQGRDPARIDALRQMLAQDGSRD